LEGATAADAVQLALTDAFATAVEVGVGVTTWPDVLDTSVTKVEDDLTSPLTIVGRAEPAATFNVDETTATIDDEVDEDAGAGTSGVTTFSKISVCAPSVQPHF
jgi:hypothetical protein